MFKKLHRQMTFFCTLITGIIMIFMSVAYLYISETGIRKNSYETFLSDISAMITSLESQIVISYEWISRIENNGKYIIHIASNGQELLYDQLNNQEFRRDITEVAQSTASRDYGYSDEAVASTTDLSTHMEYSIQDEANNEYYVSAVVIPKQHGYLSAYMIYPLKPMQDQIFYQRILFLIIVTVTVCILGIFSYFFTKQLIKPLELSKNRQVQFIASASHELRTPLAVILSSISALKLAKAEEAPRFTAAIESEGQRMTRLIDDLLLLASADNRSWSINEDSIELDTLVLNVYEKFEPLAGRKQISFSVHLPEETVPSFCGDRERLEQVLSIILDNAISYTPTHGQIILGMDLKGDTVRLTVADNGPGIPDPEKKQIWNRFYRAEEKKGKKKHFGLGLSIAKEIISLHKGKIWVENSHLGGSVFIIQLYPQSLNP